VVVPVILALNLLVFGAWQVAKAQGGLPFIPGSGEPSVLGWFMTLNFMVSSKLVLAGHWWGLLTSVFSHEGFFHFLINMVVLWSFGSLLERLWGPRLFSGFYLVAGVVASISHCLVSSILIGNASELAVGASGAISGLLIAYALMFPKQKILLFGVIPLPAMVAALLFVALDLWGLSAQAQGGGLPIGHGAHLGGALAGLVMWATVLRHRFRMVEMARPRTPAPRLSPEEAEEVERIRKTLERDGVDGLTPKQRAFLDALRARSMH
jgi:membrane associated rhomboid family serine protease